ncbi:MAG: hypothetical protein ACRDV2_00555 [Actinomycetes bacterium]
MIRRQFRLWRRDGDGSHAMIIPRGSLDEGEEANGGQNATARPWEEPVEQVVRTLRPLSRRRARRIERMRQDNDQLLAWRVQSVLVECGLTRVDFSIGGGRTLRTPQVISVVAGPPVRLTIRPLPGQTPGDFARHAPAIAHNLGVAEVRVVPAEHPLIGLELLPKPE